MRFCVLNSVWFVPNYPNGWGDTSVELPVAIYEQPTDEIKDFSSLRCLRREAGACIIAGYFEAT